MLKHPEIIEGSTPSKTDDGQVMSKGNLRIWTKYFDSIKTIKDFSKEIDLVMNLGSGSLPEEHVLMFATFIKNGLDKLPSPDELLKKDIKWSLQQLKDNIREGKDKRQDIAAILTKRLLNYSIVNEKNFTNDMVESYAEMMESGFLSSDLVLLSLRKLVGLSKFKTLILKRPKLQKMLVS